MSPAGGDDTAKDDPPGTQPVPGQDEGLDAAMAEQAARIEAGVEAQLAEHLRAVRDRLVEVFGDTVEVHAFRGELTAVVPPDRITDVLAFAKDVDGLGCELLVDISGVHWPGGTVERNAQETTGWPTYATEREGRIEIDYIVRSIANGYAFRLRVNLSDDKPVLPSVTALYGSAHIMERETYDFFGVAFEGHPELTRILMPDDWEGHPHRKDYPLGGIDVEYKGASVPPPDQRSY